MTKKIRLLIVLFLLTFLFAACIHPLDEVQKTSADTGTSNPQTTASTSHVFATSAATQASSKEEVTQPGDPYWGNEADDGQTKRY